MAAFTASQAKVDNGSKVVQINSGESVSNVRGGDFLVIANAIVEINRAYIGADNKGYFELVKNWPNSDQSNQPCIVIPTTGEFKTVVTALHEANALVNDNYQAMQAWQTQMGTVTFVNKDKTTTTVKTLKQIEADNLAQMNAYHPYPWALRTKDVEALRKANLARYDNGFVSLGRETQVSNLNLAQGLWVANDLKSNQLYMGRKIDDANTGGTAETGEAIIVVAGLEFNLKDIATDAAHLEATLHMPEAEDGTRTFDTSTGLSVKHASAAIAFASETATNKVVIRRQDVPFIEMFKREITEADPFVYAYGAIQSTASKIEGINTVQNTTRPSSYFGFYKGDTRVGKGINWLTATDTQRKTIAANLKHYIMFDDRTGKWYQYCFRVRFIKGAGNGDWLAIDARKAVKTYSDPFMFSAEAYVKPQGNLDSIDSDINTFTGGVTGSFSNINNRTFRENYKGRDLKDLKGLYVATQSGASLPTNLNVADGECYALVIGCFNRLNQGANNLSNPYGAAWIASNSGNSLKRNYWSSDALVANTVADNFILASDGGIKSTNEQTGNIGTTANGEGILSRLDNRFHDTVYNGGQGGITRDMRYSAKGITITQAKKRVNEMQGDLAPGLERETQVMIYQSSTNTNNNTYIDFDGNETNNFAVGDEIYCETEAGTYVKSTVTRIGAAFLQTEGQDNGCKVNGLVVHLKKTDTSLRGSIERNDVVIDPVNFFNEPTLALGWVGGWRHPSMAQSTRVEATRKLVSSISANRIWKAELSDNYGKSTSSPDTVKNDMFIDPSHIISILNYRYKAKVTTESDVKGALEYFDVFYTVRDIVTFGSTFAESLIGKVLKNTYSNNHKGYAPTLNLNISPQTNLIAGVTHAPIDLDNRESGALGIKVLSSVFEEDGLLYAQFNFIELVCSGSDWGDSDSQIPIVPNLSTTINDNATSVIVGTARSAEPLGVLRYA